MRGKINFNYILVLIGSIIEIFVFTFLKNDYHYYRLPIINILGASLVAIGFYRQSTRTLNLQDLAQKSSNKLIYRYITLLFGLVYLFFIVKMLSPLMKQFPVDAGVSDVIPTIEIMARRLMLGEYPYKTVYFNGYSFNPGYLTLQYASFIPALILDLDLRIYSILIFSILLIIIIIYHTYSTKDLIKNLLILSLIFFLFYGLSTENYAVLTNSVEFIDVAFYLFLAWAIFIRNPFVVALGLLGTILTRYGILIWIPLYAFIYYYTNPKNKTFQVILFTLVGLLVFYILPFMTREPNLFFKGVDNYNQMAVGQWGNVPDWFKHVNKPYTLTQGPGLAIFINDYLGGSTLFKINLIQKLQILFCLLWIIISGLLFWKKRKSLQSSYFLLFTLKVYLCIFYSFIFVPYSYLFMVPLGCSIFALIKLPLFQKDE